ncbi:non-homologous end-joining DNA ligase [Terriglobus roseus]|nr:non-homologous end-joining DNA ligase [Terriglobus roseus]
MPAPTFTAPMECLAVKRLPEGPAWTYEIKLDGYRAQAIRGSSGVQLFSRNGKPLTEQAHGPCSALKLLLPTGTSVDGELCALDTAGRPSFQLMQNRKSRYSRLVFYAFDLLHLSGKSMLAKPLYERRQLLAKLFEGASGDAQLAISVQVPLQQMLDTVRAHSLEGVIAKRLNELYEPGKRSGFWMKQRMNMAQEFVVGGYTPSDNGVDALLLGFYRDDKLFFCSSVRNGFVPASRRSIFQQLRPYLTEVMPFANLPEKNPGRWGQGLTAEKMRNCVWLRPEMVAQCEFLEWTDNDHLRHASFKGLRPDKDARAITKEEAQ